MNARIWLVAAALPMAAFAQQPPEDGAPAANAKVNPAAAAEQTEVLPALTVTGSHLLRSTTAEMPITTVSVDAIQESGARSLGEYLQSLPMMSGSPLNTAVGAREGGGKVSRGTETVELRGLGAERTLVLINGRRMVAGGNGTAGVVDLSSIPLGMIDRIEILKTGASVEYGADAVAGVVNVITRDQIDGVHLRASAQQTDRSDGQSARISVVSGGLLGTTHLVAGMEWFDQASVGKGDRDFSSALLTVDGENNTVIPGGSSAPPQGNFRTSDGRVTLMDGRSGTSTDDFRPFIGSGPDNDRYNFNPFEDLIQESQRMSAFAQLNHSWAWMDGYIEAHVQRRDSQTQLAPLPFFSNRLDGVSVSADNIFNPFDEEIRDARRRIVEAGPRRFTQSNQLWRVATGLDGQWGAAYWDINASYGRNSVDQTQSGDWLRDRVGLALGPSFDSGSGLRCGVADNAIDGCVPLNLFGGPGSITPAMQQYLVGDVLEDRFVNAQTVLSAGYRQELLKLPAGPLGIAAGVEFRDESASDRPDPQTQAGNTTGSAREKTRGSYQAREAYLEIGVPLLKQAPGAYSLTLETGIRVVDYSNFSTHLVSDLGLYYQPVKDWTLRAAFSQAFRAPTVAELFGGAVQSNPAVDDPCANFAALDDAQIDRCVAQGVPADGSFDQTGNETPQIGGGDAGLEPEEAEVFTAGVNWSPSAIPDLSLKLDYYDIRIDNGIAALGASTILAQCIENGVEEFCSRISRDGEGAITEVRGQLQNLASETARGLDLEISHRVSLVAGRVQQRLLLSHVLERGLRAFPGAEPFAGEGSYDPDNFGAIPEWKGRYSLDWSRKRLSAGYGVQWIGALDERGGELYPGTRNRIEAVVYHDLRLGWQAPAGWELGLSLTNLSDEDPPFFANADLANTDVSTYRLLGRTIQLSFKHVL